jgi:predicted TIM-barrel fold metal-dependent hydrolase
MIIDANCHIGHWPFRRLWTTTVDGLLRMLDRAGIDRAIVSHTHGIFYRNPHESNAELYDAVKAHRDRFIPFACLHPEYAGWRDDLKQCVEEWGMRGLRLYPSYHDGLSTSPARAPAPAPGQGTGYALGGDAAAELLAEAAARNLPVSVACAFEDPRQRHHLDTAPDLTEHDIAAAVRRHPQVRFLFTTTTVPVIEMVVRHLPYQDNVAFDTSGLSGPLSNSIQEAYSLLGPRRLLLGSLAPFEYPEVALLRLEFLDASDDALSQIKGGNVRWLLGDAPP